MCHDNEEWCKIEDELTYQFKIDMKTLTNVHPSTQKSQNLHFNYYYYYYYIIIISLFIVDRIVKYW